MQKPAEPQLSISLRALICSYVKARDLTQREGLNPYRAQERKIRIATRVCSVPIMESGKSLGLPEDSQQQHSSECSHWDAGGLKDISSLTDTINNA